MSLRGLLVLGVLVAAIAAERFAYYGLYSFLAIDLRAQEGSLASVGMTFVALQAVLVVGMVAGGAAALGVGPRVTAAGGVLLAVAGHFAVAAGAPILVGSGLVAFGAGTFRPCVFAAAAELLTSEDNNEITPNPLRFAGMTAFAFAAYGGTNIGSALAPVVAGVLRDAHERSVSSSVNGAIALFAAMLAGVAAWPGLLAQPAPAEAPLGAGPYRKAPVPVAATPVPPSTGIAGLAILAGPTVMFMIGGSLARPPMDLVRDMASLAWLFAIHPIVASITSIALLGAAIAAVLNRWLLPPLLLYAAGLVVFGTGLIPIAFTRIGGADAVMLYATGALLTAMGEAATMAIAIAYAALAVRGRGAALAVGMWLALMTGATSIAGPIAVLGVRMPLTAAVALICMACGVALLVLGRQMHRAFFDPVPLVPAAP